MHCIFKAVYIDRYMQNQQCTLYPPILLVDPREQILRHTLQSLSMPSALSVDHYIYPVKLY